jgi:hypothetical protein
LGNTKFKAMARTVQSIENQIMGYVSNLPDKKKKAVLSVVKTIAEDNYATEFEKKWAKAIPLDDAFEEVHNYIKTLEWKK